MGDPSLRKAIARTSARGSVFPDPDWSKVEKILHGKTAGAEWDDAISMWMDALHATCGPPYAAHRQGPVTLFTSLGSTAAEALVARAVDAVERLRAELPRVCAPPRCGRVVILHFPSAKQYQQYVLSYLPNAGTGGAVNSATIDCGLAHCAVYGEHSTALERAVGHELVHVMTRALALPPWLDEGLAADLEDVGAERRARRTPDRAALRSMRSEAALEHFWRGTHLIKGHAPAGGACELALALVRALRARHAGVFEDFALAVTRSPDSGRAAARERLGTNLDALAHEILGSAGWRPWELLARRHPRDARRASLEALALALAILLAITYVASTIR